MVADGRISGEVVEVRDRAGNLLFTYSGADPRWTGGPSQVRITAISELTGHDPLGRAAHLASGAWRPLRSAEDFAELNRAVKNLEVLRR